MKKTSDQGLELVPHQFSKLSFIDKVKLEQIKAFLGSQPDFTGKNLLYFFPMERNHLATTHKKFNS